MILHAPVNALAGSNAGQTGKPQSTAPSWNATKMRAAAQIIDPEVMSHSPEQMDPGFKNPCWKSKLHNGEQQLHCLPYFYLTTFHGGSISLAKKLLKHPNIAFVSGI